MACVLFVNACVRGEKSRTQQLARRFLEVYAAKHPGDMITERNLCRERLQPQYPEVLAERDALWNGWTSPCLTRPASSLRRTRSW